jgi:hypothetical protein
VHAVQAQRALSLCAQSSVKREFSRSYRMEQHIRMRSTKLVFAATIAIMLASAPS